MIAQRRKTCKQISRGGGTGSGPPGAPAGSGRKKPPGGRHGFPPGALRLRLPVILQQEHGLDGGHLVVLLLLHLDINGEGLQVLLRGLGAALPQDADHPLQDDGVDKKVGIPVRSRRQSSQKWISEKWILELYMVKGGSHTPGAPRRRPPCSVTSVGGGLCPAPLARSVFAPIFRWFGIPSTPCRGGPMCPPGHTSARDPLTGRHTGRPLRSSCKLHRPRTTGGGGARPYRASGAAEPPRHRGLLLRGPQV